jgi:hypothetical protein
LTNVIAKFYSKEGANIRVVANEKGWLNCSEHKAFCAHVQAMVAFLKGAAPMPHVKVYEATLAHAKTPAVKSAIYAALGQIDKTLKEAVKAGTVLTPAKPAPVAAPVPTPAPVTPAPVAAAPVAAPESVIVFGGRWLDMDAAELAEVSQAYAASKVAQAPAPAPVVYGCALPPAPIDPALAAAALCGIAIDLD